jgi:hypothetical protein
LLRIEKSGGPEKQRQNYNSDFSKFFHNRLPRLQLKAAEG